MVKVKIPVPCHFTTKSYFPSLKCYGWELIAMLPKRLDLHIPCVLSLKEFRQNNKMQLLHLVERIEENALDSMEDLLNEKGYRIGSVLHSNT